MFRPTRLYSYSKLTVASPLQLPEGLLRCRLPTFSYSLLHLADLSGSQLNGDEDVKVSYRFASRTPPLLTASGKPRVLQRSTA